MTKKKKATPSKQRFVSFEDFVAKKCFADDWNHVENQLRDSLYTNNVLKYFSMYMKEHGQHLLSEFWNSTSDANSLEATNQDQQILDFRKWIQSRF